MSDFCFVNPNPKNKLVGDCTVRAICLADGRDWEKIYFDLAVQGYTLADMPSSNDTWGKYLLDNGWNYKRLQDNCPFCYTIDNFADEYHKGTFIVATGTHVVTVQDGTILDTWDSRQKQPLFFFERK